jgi:hypothetical protein
MTLPTSTHPACIDPDVLLKDCQVRRLRRGGPGGQRRNKVETAVELVHRPSGVAAEASERRSQHENLKVAVRRLRILLAIRVRNEPSGIGAADDLAHCASADNWRGIGSRHRDFPCVLAKLLDALAEADWNVADTARQAGSTSSQIVKLLALAPEALSLLNDQRATRGLRPLRPRA